MSGGVVTFVQRGTCVIDANQAAGDANYLSAAESQQSIGVLVTLVQTSSQSGTTTPPQADGARGRDFDLGWEWHRDVLGNAPRSRFALNSTSGTLSVQEALPVGSYALSGTDSDALGDSGSWAYTLDVNSGVIQQSGSTSGSIEQSETKGHTITLNTSGLGTTTFAGDIPAGFVLDASSGTISITKSLAVGTCELRGSDTDTFGDAGSWSYALTVAAGTIVQVGADLVVSRLGIVWSLRDDRRPGASWRRASSARSLRVLLSTSGQE